MSLNQGAIATSFPEAHSPPAGPTATVTLDCPLCDYNLTGLTEPRCPECGHIFEWADLTDPARMNLKWLFEHRKWLGGYLSTQVALLRRPIAYWRTLRPSHVVRPRRLITFWLVGMLALVLPLTVLVVGNAAVVVQAASLQSRRFLGARLPPLTNPNFAAYIASTSLPGQPPLPTNPTYGDLDARRLGVTTKAYLDGVAPLFGMPGFSQRVISNLRRLATASFVLIFPPLTLLSCLLVLLVMRQSFSRVKVRRVHTLRVAVYAADVLPFTLLFALPVGQQLFTLFSRSTPSNARFPTPFFLVAAAAALTIWLVRFHAALKHYLGIPHRPGILIASLVIALLGMAIVYVWVVGL